MRLADMLRIALASLAQQKARTLLTMLGVVIGTFSLVVTFSLGGGFRKQVERQFSGPQLRQITVWPGTGVKEADIPPQVLEIKGPMSAAKRERIRKAIIHRWPRKGSKIQLTRQRMRELEKIPHVQAVVPLIQEPCRVVYENKARRVITFAAAADNKHFRQRMVAGEFLPSDESRCVVVNEYLLYLWGLTSDEDAERVVGRKLRVEYRPRGWTAAGLAQVLGGGLLNLNDEESKVLTKALPQMPALIDMLSLTPNEKELLKKTLARLSPPAPAPTSLQFFTSPLVATSGVLCPAAPLTSGLISAAAALIPEQAVFFEDFTICGVIREFVEDEDENDILDLGPGVMSRRADVFLPVRMAEELFSRGSYGPETGLPGAVVYVDREENLKEVSKEIKRMGLQEFSLADFMQNLRGSLFLVILVTALLAAVALLVAALGITNTMVMSVLERTREIGIMKAVGARNRHIQLIFLLEGALIGMIGGALGLLLSWLASFPADSLARSLLQEQAHFPLRGTLFIFPLWLTLGAPAFACLVTTLAALYPARQSTRVNPITALRHE
jgi:putative ABC transport system permease protein